MGLQADAKFENLFWVDFVVLAERYWIESNAAITPSPSPGGSFVVCV